MLMVMNWLDIVLIIESVVQIVVICMLCPVVVLMFTLWLVVPLVLMRVAV